MSKWREIADYIDDIRNAIAEVEEFTRGMNYEDFTADKKPSMPLSEASKC
jgi:uncharacterized protein with HEPN domain